MTKTMDLDPDPDPGEGASVGSRGKLGLEGSGWGGRGHVHLSRGPQFDPVLPSDPPSPDSPTETFAAPAEVRHFTDGSFPAGFALQLFSHTHLRASDRRDLPKEGRGAEGGPLQPESPSPGERLSGGGRCAVLGRPCPWVAGLRAGSDPRAEVWARSLGASWSLG